MAERTKGIGVIPLLPSDGTTGTGTAAVGGNVTTREDPLTSFYGKETVNYFSGSPLNRVAFLRTDHAFLSAAFRHPSARMLLVDEELRPLAFGQEHEENGIYYGSLADVEGLFARNTNSTATATATVAWPFEKSEDDVINGYDSAKPKEPLVLFLGIDDGVSYIEREEDKSGKGASAEHKNQKENVFTWKEYSGQPYFAIHVALTKNYNYGNMDMMTTGVTKETVDRVKKTLDGKGLVWMKDVRGMKLSPSDAATYAIARHVLDWNTRNPFCSSCGTPTIAVHAGWKRVCPPADKNNNSETPACPSRRHVSNVTFPRTDPTVIAAVIRPGPLPHVLLGRQKRWPARWYSTLAGFVEPGESLEEAVAREVWEESGVRVSRVHVHSSQPWPFPGGLMIGCIAVANNGNSSSDDEIYLGHDKELEDARWFDLNEIKDALENGATGLGDPEDKKTGDQRKGWLRVPPRTAIANRLIAAAVDLCVRMKDQGQGEDEEMPGKDNGFNGEKVAKI